LTSQMRRASSSVVMNLVEGANRLTKRDYRHFVAIARGSVGEVRYQLMLAKDLGFLKTEEYEQLRCDYKRVGQMLTKLGQSLVRG
jgi:four helix bundle protein